MSAKQTYSKPQANWPNLPPEIWTLIFRHATLVPDLLSTDLDNYDKHDPAMRRQRKSFKQPESLVTRRCLVLVCKAWYANAICFLYESLWLGRGKDVATLFEALRRSHNVSSDATLPLGWWTKRIDVAMRDSTNDPNRDVALVGDIIAMLPNLSIIILDVMGHLYFSKVRNFPSSVLLSTSPENLKVAYCCCLDVVPHRDDWLPFLNSRPHLRSISDFDPIDYPFKYQGIPHCLSSLTSIHISHSWTLDLLRYLELPNLQHLTYCIDDLYRDLPSPGPLFRKHGVQLRSLALNFLTPWMIDLILETCPNLVILELIVESWTDLTTDITTFPPINLIKIASRKLQGKSAFYSRMFDFVVQAKTICPTLKTVRLSDERNVAGLKTHPRLLRDQLEVLRAAGVAFEDAEGRLLHPG